MTDDFMPWVDPYADIEGDTNLPDTSGVAVAGSAIGADGAPMSTGAGGCMPLAWGAENDPQRSSVTGWVTACTLGTVVTAYLQAAVWGGKLWLRITETAGGGGDTATAATFAPLASGETPSTPPLFSVGANGENDALPGGVYPGWSICPMESAEGLLKTTGGAWRGELEWCPLATFSVYKTDPVAHLGAVPWAVTLWLIPCGNTLCFWVTESARRVGDSIMGATERGSDWRRYNSLERVGRESFTSEQWETLDLAPGLYNLGEVPTTALTPWQLDGTTPAEPGNGGSFFPIPSGGLGTLNIVPESADGVPPLSPQPCVFSSAHCILCDGVTQRENWRYKGDQSVPPVNPNPYNGRTLRQWVETMLTVGYIHLNWKLASNWPVENSWYVYRQPWLYRFDPWAANGRGYYGGSQWTLSDAALGGIHELASVTIGPDSRLSADDCTEDWAAKNWGEWASPLRITASYETDLPNNGGHLVLLLAGTEIGTTLCTASCFGIDRT